MFKSLYSFKASYATAISFKEGEIFIELPGAKSDKNWYFVTGLDGKSGFVPRNYMKEITISPAEQFRFLCEVQVNMTANPAILNTEKKENLQKLGVIKKKLADSLQDCGQDDISSCGGASLEAMKKSAGSKDSLTSIRSSKKRAAPQPPVRKPHERSGSDCSEQSSLSPRHSPRPPSSLDLNTTTDSIPEEKEISTNLHVPVKFETMKISRQTSSSSSVSGESGGPEVVTVTYQQPQESCRSKALEMVELVRERSGLSHTASTTLLNKVLSDLVTSQKDLNVLVPSLLKELQSQLFNSESEIVKSNDYSDLVNIFDQLTKAKEDEQQRNWMLYEDEAVIVGNLGRLRNTLSHANPDISRSVVSRYKYCHVQNLIEYYQMETRWSIRRILIECFTLMASIDGQIISLMITSVLPLELAQDMFENSEDTDRLKQSALLLTVIFSQGEAIPIHYLEQLGNNFIKFLLDKIENPPASDSDEIIADAFMALIAAYNLQFEEVDNNVILVCLGEAASAKIFTEKLLLLFNREEDPAAIIGDREGVNSIHKLVLDVFSSDACIVHFYTNDLMVLIDIIARQLCDLGPGLERYTYLEMAHSVLTRSGYEEHFHRLSDLKACLQRIQREEGDSVDKTKVSEICNSFSCFRI